MMMLPGTTTWPPNFLCAIARISLLAGLDAGDAQHGERLAMPVLAAVVVPPLLLEDDHLVAADLLDHLGRDGRAAGAALGIGALADHEHAVEGHLGARLAGELLDGDQVVLGNFVLLAAGASGPRFGLVSAPFRRPARATPAPFIPVQVRRGARVVDRGGLENR